MLNKVINDKENFKTDSFLNLFYYWKIYNNLERKKTKLTDLE